MEDIQFQNIIKIFEEAKITDPAKKFLLYLHAIIACNVCHDFKEEKSFIGYEDAWASPIADALREYLPKLEKTDKDFVLALSEQVEGSDGLDFLHTVVPDLVPGEIDRLFIDLNEEPRGKMFYQLSKLWAVIQVHKKIEKQAHPVGSGSFTLETLSNHIFQTYLQWRKSYPRYEKIWRFEEKDFFQIWSFAYGSPFRTEPVKVKGEAQQTIGRIERGRCF